MNNTLTGGLKPLFRQYFLLSILFFTFLQVEAQSPPPVVFYVSSYVGTTGTQIIISGQNLLPTQNLVLVSFGGQPAASLIFASSTQLIATVGAGATGTLLITYLSSTNGQVILFNSPFTFFSPPLSIQNFSPGTGGAGTEVTIYGHGFTGATFVSFGGTVSPSFTVVNDEIIDAVVGNGASGEVSVTTPAGGTATDTGFIFIPPPAITSFTPNFGCPGTLVTIKGANFTNAGAVSVGGINDTSFSVNSDTSITAIVNSGTGTIEITTPAGTGTSNAVYSLGSAATTYAYIAHDNVVSVVDVNTNTVTGTIPVGANPYGVAISPGGSKVYVTNANDNTVSVINTATNKVTDTIAVGNFPLGIVVSPDGSKVYVANATDSTVSVINAVSDTIIATIKVGASPSGICITPNGNKVYVTNWEDFTVSVINTSTNTVINTIQNAGGNPKGICVSPDGSKVYLADYMDDNIKVINTVADTILAVIYTQFDPPDVCISPDGNTVYVTNTTNNGSGIVSVISTATNLSYATIPVGSYPTSISITPDGSKVYVVNGPGQNMSIINTTTNTVTDSLVIANGGIGSFGNFIGNMVKPCQDIWTGSVSTAWENPANWSLGAIPGATIDVIINSGAIHYPVISSNAVCKSITVDPAAKLTISSNYSLDVKG